MNARFRIIVVGAGLLLLLLALLIATPRRTQGGVAAAVQVVNPYVPIEVENSSRTPYEFGAVITSANDSASSDPIPTNKRLVIDFVSADCLVEPGSYLEGFALAANTNNHYFFPQFNQSGPGREYGFSQQTHIYVESGQTFSVSAIISDPNSNCGVDVTGYLVNR